jgi:hypothetical protein
MRAGLGLAMLAGLAWGQTAPDTATEIASIRDRVRTYLDELPRITCIESTRQTISIPLAKLTETREDSCDTRQYKLFAVQSMAGLAGRANREPKPRKGLNRSPASSDWRDQLKEASLTAGTGFLAVLVDSHGDARFRRVRTG